MSARAYSLATQPSEAMDHALQVIRGGGVFLFPTETVYGLGADSASAPAVERLYEMKGRPREKLFQWLIADPAPARAASEGWDERAEKLAARFWPGPLTLVVPAKNGAIGWRVPRHEWLLRILKALQHPLAATSANRAGHPPSITFPSAFQEFADAVELAVDGGDLEHGTASTVVSLETREPRILREGGISREDIFQALA